MKQSRFPLLTSACIIISFCFMLGSVFTLLLPGDAQAGCTTNADCVGYGSSAPVCLTSGQCGCNTNSDCPSVHPVCVNGMCTGNGGCTSNADCGSVTQPVCLTSGQCGCNTASDCPLPNSGCIFNTCTAMSSGCQSNGAACSQASDCCNNNCSNGTCTSTVIPHGNCPIGYSPAGPNGCCAAFAQQPAYTTKPRNASGSCLPPPAGFPIWEGDAPGNACYFCPQIPSGYVDNSGGSANVPFACHFCPSGGTYVGAGRCATSSCPQMPEMPGIMVIPFLLAAGGITWLYRRRAKTAG